ncbi:MULTISPECIES: GNAT family N-acetyltransferase [Bifidobacterium]|uniref:GNAT family N-acetyltransferase n=1 Tax=Bifidobacterium TaxID=1678 RepID=UPI001BDBEF97|nr:MULTISPECIES: GNAT family N-acetyltransferase [Bifidobacterium]MBT1161863.1 GNAT family N-acetyltransferase [Bifidobacterium sp. SO1]MBW3079431.1 GNAT family N-acetyltransferase [Bifidobacterium simiiventris]
MTVYRDAKPEETDEIVDLINYAFGMQAQKILAKAYAESGETLASRHKVAVDETTGRIVASVGVYPQTMHVGGRQLNVMFLGCVCVHPRSRGEGHMGRLIGMWHDELRAEGNTDLMVLWGLRHRYAYFGYTPCGYDYTYSVNQSCAKHALAGVDTAGITFRTLFSRDGDAQLADRLNRARLVYAERPLPVIDRICTYLNSEAIAIDRNGEPIGYLIRALADPSVVREIALADPADAPAVAKAYLASLAVCRKEAFTVRVSPTDAALNEQFAAFGEDTKIGCLCRCTIFDYATVLDAYLSAAARLWRLEPGRFSAVLDGQPVTITVSEREADDDGHAVVGSGLDRTTGRQSVTVERTADPDAPRLSHMDAQDLLLGLGARFRHDLPVAPAGWFPLPMCWYWPDLN